MQNIQSVCDSYLLIRNSSNNYSIVDYDFNVVYNSNVKVKSNSICGISENGDYFAVANGKEIIVINTKSDKKSVIKLEKYIYTLSFVNSDTLLFGEFSDTISNHYDYTFYLYDADSETQEFFREYIGVDLSHFYCDSSGFSTLLETDDEAKICVQKFSGECKEYSINKLLPYCLYRTVSFGEGGSKFICLSRKNIFKKADLYLVDLNTKKSTKLLSIRNKDLFGIPPFYILYFLDEKHFAVKLNDRICVYDFSSSEPLISYPTTDISLRPVLIKNSDLLLSNGKWLVI